MKNIDENTIVIVGLGYVGLPLAVAFAQSGSQVIGFDTNADKIALYKNGEDPTGEIGTDKLSKVIIEYTADETCIARGRYVIVAVPTPIGESKNPDLNPVELASRIVGRNMSHGTVVIFESTVYPGVTEEICLPILEKESGMKSGVDFKIGYSPERVNPGDKKNTLENIIKVVSGMDEETLDEVASLYNHIIKAGVYRAPTIRVAEAAKVVENTQRDINIAFMNELAVIFDKLGIDTRDVLAAASTKWNFLKFYPGLVGGHCIGVDPYYLTYKSERNGFVSKLILTGRELNEYMSTFVAQKAIKMMIRNSIRIKGSRVLVLGLTFKENVSDLRNSKVADIVNELIEYEIETFVCDTYADKYEAMSEYGIMLSDLENVHDIDCLILAVAHDNFKQLSKDTLFSLFKDGQRPVVLDLKGILPKEEFQKESDFYRL